MKSFTQGRNRYGTLTKNTATANLTAGDEMANDIYREICAKHDWPWLERLRTKATVAGTQFYNLPYDCDQVRAIAVIVSSKRYTPTQCPDRATWDQLNFSSYNSDIPEKWFVFNGQIGLWPTPATSSNTINVTQKSRVIDLSAADYTTGSIVSIANGATTVTGTGTTWTAQMTGRYIRITYSDTANTGDGLWYEIASVTDTTHLELVRAYGGTSIAAGTAAYNIGQMPLMPEAYHLMPWIGASAEYWNKEGDDRSVYLQGQFDRLMVGLERTWMSPTTDYVIDDGGDQEMNNPNLTISL